MRIRRILVATDFSDCSGPALKAAVSLARSFSTPVVVLHACELVIPGDIYGAVEVVSLNEGIRASARKQVESLVGRVRRQGVRCTGVTREGPAAEVIAGQAARSGDLIVMGTHGRRGFSRLFIGSVAERVVRSARCPVLTVPSPAKRSEPKRRAPRAKSRKTPKSLP